MKETLNKPIQVCPICGKVDITPETHECDLNRIANNENY
jgi:hypothetical protein